VRDYGVFEEKINEIEAQAEKERKEMETKRNAKIISDFLHFNDITDFTCLDQTHVFLPRYFSQD
jgi:hypothetical protein